MLKRVEEFVRGKEAWIASADAEGRPHLSLGKVEAARGQRVWVSGWFCPRILANLETNRAVSVTVRGPHEGYQLLGQVEEQTVDALLDGYAPDEAQRVPSARYRLTVAVGSVLEMGDAPHSDEELT